MANNSLRIPHLFALVAILAGCATPPPPPPPAPEPQPVALPAEPQPPVLVKPDYPERYVVVKGDTLWDIAARFLEDPWRWPEVWENNQQIANPHLIYPGDVLTLVYIEGRPVIQVQRNVKQQTKLPEVRLSPKVREESLNQAIPTIPIDAIKQFLTRPRVVTENELEAAPYIVSSSDRHLIAGPGNRVYVRGLKDVQQAEYAVVRPGVVYRNPDDPDQILGYEAINVADARVKELGDPATLEITSASLEVLNGDRLLPTDDTMPDTSFSPRAPANMVKGHILAVPGGVSLIGQFQVVAIDLGRQQEMVPGHVLAIKQAGEVIRDRYQDNDPVKMPDERAGVLMVFRVFDRISYALVMKAQRTIHVGDVVTNP